MVGRCGTISVIGLALMLAGCGGSDDSQPVATSSAVAVVAAPASVAASATSSSTSSNPSTSSLNILFLGGSITRGSGASTLAKSYPQLVTAWLQAKYRAVNVWNIAVGGTTSEFATYRLERDLGTFKPDVAVIDYAVNDPMNKSAVYGYTDALIYKLRKANPSVRIIYLAATQPGDEANRRVGNRDARSVWAQEIMGADGEAYVDGGGDIWRQVLDGEHAATDFFADDIHPNDLGHAAYATALETMLTSVLAAGTDTPKNGSIYIGQTHLDTAHMLNRDAVVTGTSCTLAQSNQLDAWQQQISYYDQAMSCAAGQSFTAQFTGTTIGLVNLNTPNGGGMDCRLDGSVTATISQPGNVTWTWPQLIFTSQANGSHTLTCIARGNWMIGEFMVSSASPLSVSQ